MARLEKRWLIAAGVACLCLLSSGAANGQMRMGTRPGFFEASVGPVVGIVNTNRLWFQSAFEIGGHFEGNSGGPALSGAFDFLARPDWFGMEMGVKFRWDIQVRRNLALYLAPTVQGGYALYSHNFDAPRHYFNFQFGFEIRMIFNNRLILFFRPFSFNFNVSDHLEASFDTGVGLGVSF